MRTQTADWITAGTGDATRYVQCFQCPITGKEIAIVSMNFGANLTLKKVDAIAVIDGIVGVSFSVRKWSFWDLLRGAQPRSELHHKELRWGESLNPRLSDIHQIRALSSSLVIIWSTS